MATLDLLPATTYCPPSPAQVRRQRKALNTIVEDDAPSRPALALESRAQNQAFNANLFSPLSDHFPTPRGNHFMVAPYIPSSPSSVAGSDYSQSLSAPWTRDSFATQVTEFDELYDVSSDEEDHRKPTRASLSRSSSQRQQTAAKRQSAPPTNRGPLPTLIIPSEDGEQWISPTKKFSSPIPPTPPPKLPMSPTLFEYLSTQEVLSSSATPSLDGSLSSDQLAAMSAPPTPHIGSVCGDDEDPWGGIQLQPDAMATLQALSGDDAEEIFEQQTEQVLELSAMSPTLEMQQSPPPLITNIRRHDSIVLSPQQQRSLDSLSKLEIPSPGGFFSSLSVNSRNTWHLVPLSPQSAAPPSSTTAESFYKTPWASEPVEQVVEVSDVMSDDCPTARPTFKSQSSEGTVTVAATPEPYTEEEIVATEILDEYDDGYIRKLENAASENIDRTSMWLNAQTSYLSALISPPEDRDDETAFLKRGTEAAKAVDSSTAPAQKAVRFSEVITAKTVESEAAPLPKPKSQESAYYRSFKHFVNRSRYRDAYVHSLPRFEALQAQRVHFPEAYRKQLLGKYQLSVKPMSAKKRMSSNVARGDETPPEDAENLKADKEYEALEQMRAANWNVMASKMLNGGRLIAAPVAKRLARISRMGPTANGAPRDRARILDLGGQATCDWAWHCATEYPNTKVYTVTTKAIRQLSNSNIRGPKNHRQVAVEKLNKLPFADNHFDVISARNLYSILKISSENGEDEYDACLKECMRCLKPGGYLEFSLLDSDIVNAGPQGQARSVEFGFNLKTRGYDPTPTKAWLGRLRKAGFVGIKRAWLFLPMGAPLTSTPSTRDSMGVEVPLELEAMVSGSTNAAATITGLRGGCAWEKWMLKLQVESGKNDDSLLEDVYNIIEEGRKCGAGWRTLNGWARKPLAN
jgi:SAM-dependent methyltransferase